ncbi:MAG: hypothetical protein L3J04_08380 [Robiginitomaculum sp.]|nr:hypothetical protein [Robiginitomaculum sp.]
MKLKFATGHVSVRLTISQMQQLVDNGSLSSTIPLAGGALNGIISLVDEPMTNMQFDANSSTIGFVFPRDAVQEELAKPTRNGIGGYFDDGVFSLAIDMHDVRDKARKAK